MKNSCFSGKRGGFTLIEILMVITIIGVLAGVVVIGTGKHVLNSKRKATALQAATIKSAISQFDLALGRDPKNLEELVFEGDEDWPGPFLDSEEVPKDSWGQDFKMERVGKRMKVISAAQDGEFGTEDDISK